MGIAGAAGEVSVPRPAQRTDIRLRSLRMVAAAEGADAIAGLCDRALAGDDSARTQACEIEEKLRRVPVVRDALAEARRRLKCG